MQRLRPLIPYTPPTRRPPTEKKAFWLQRVRQPVPVADGAGAPQGGVPALERLVVLAQRQRRQRRVPRGPPPPALMPPPHRCRGPPQAAGHLRVAPGARPQAPGPGPRAPTGAGVDAHGAKRTYSTRLSTLSLSYVSSYCLTIACCLDREPI